MPDKLIDIKNRIVEITLLEAVNKIVIALPGNNNFLGLKAQLKKLDQDIYGEAISLGDYNVGLANKRRALDFFLEHLEQNDFEKVYIIFFPSGTQRPGLQPPCRRSHEGRRSRGQRSTT